jgi:hypothetical protein
MLSDRLCDTREQRKAWSQNLGHEHLATTIVAYMLVSRERRGELLRMMNPTEVLGSGTAR